MNTMAKIVIRVCAERLKVDVVSRLEEYGPREAIPLVITAIESLEDALGVIEAKDKVEDIE